MSIFMCKAISITNLYGNIAWVRTSLDHFAVFLFPCYISECFMKEAKPYLTNIDMKYKPDPLQFRIGNYTTKT